MPKSISDIISEACADTNRRQWQDKLKGKDKKLFEAFVEAFRSGKMTNKSIALRHFNANAVKPVTRSIFNIALSEGVRNDG